MAVIPSAVGPLLVTERLELWLPARRDVAAMFEIVADPDTSRFLGGAANPGEQFTRFSRNAGSWLLYGYGSFILRLRGFPDVIGNAGIFHSWRDLGPDFDDMPEAGWILRRDAWGKGIAQEAMDAALAWFDKEHGPQRVVCMIDPDNGASLRLAARLKFSPMRDARLADGAAVRLLERG